MEVDVKRLLASVVVAMAVAVAALGAQSAAWQVPRTPDGHPDLQGVWSNNSVTPMTRPTQWKDKEKLTDTEVKELQSLVAKYVSQGGDAVFGNYIQIALDMKEKGAYDQISYDPTTGNYNQFWMVDRDWDNRTSLIIAFQSSDRFLVQGETDPDTNTDVFLYDVASATHPDHERRPERGHVDAASDRSPW